jgi:Domain of unknown function (DUF1902)
MDLNLIIVRAEWDDDAKVWVATSDDIGLVTEAASIEALREKIPAMVGDLLEGENLLRDLPIEIIAHTHTRIRAGVAA